ncbi:hypothetical protein RhiirA4_427641 [Rhizophagus irregularis]|uniref:DDE Tnp4 domain-containing protein n=1 Tax=Rhizophagus irregularis TaxID=588596 RepID=A0A2I1H9S5_9GLOM|nr:hypothetical protein RhiirA4_427641 [Rhizophagus irregularis]
MSEHKNIEELLSFYVITSCQDMEDEDLFESEENSSEEEENEMVMLGLTSLLGTRYLEQRNFHVAKSKHWYYNILPKYDDYRFKIIMRMDSLNFQKLVLTLSTHQIFHNNSCHLQAPVEFQLAIFLRRIGSKENIFEICSRVVVENAFGRLKNRFKALKELNSRKISNVVQLTECAIILHNFLELNNDNIEELFEDDDNEDDEDDEDDRDNENEENQNEIALKREGERKREYIMNQIIDP